MLPLKETKHGIIFSIQVVPRASKCEISGVVDDVLKIRLTAPPVEGKANEECLRFLSDRLDLARNRFAIVGGQTSRRKIIQVADIRLDELAALLKRIVPVKQAPDLFATSSRKDENP